MSGDSIKKAIRKVAAAKKALAREIAATHPVGSEIRYLRGHHDQVGRVRYIDSFKGLSIKVENVRTGKSYWIGMYDIYGLIE